MARISFVAMFAAWLPYFFFFNLIFSTLAASGLSRTYDYGHSSRILLSKRDDDRNDSQNALVQATRYNGSIPLRPEFRDLENNHEQWNLYLLALSWMQWTNQSDPKSWYRITGIHGAPFTDYGGVEALTGNQGNGYCTHVSMLFPTWHRPYLVLYEQILYNITNMIATWYPDERREAFQKAAENFRIPYWDWALKPANGTSVFPLALGGSSEVEVDGPNGKQNISNPLFSYTFHPLDASAFDEYPFMYWNETKRRPTPIEATNATSDNGWVAQTLDKSLPGIQQRLYALFSNSKNYSTWSNEAWIPDGSNSSLDSIESLHDTVHLAVGGNYGHMAIIAYSAPDPAFFLLHANIDRLFAMWQLVNNDSWIEPTQAILPTRTITMGDNQTSLTDLTPFYFNETNFWNSDQVRNHTIFGYSYADVVSGNRSDVVAVINKLYTDFSPATMTLETSNDVESDSQPQRRSSMSIAVKNGSYREWTVNIIVNKFALGGSFNIHLFLGGIPKFPAKWELADNKFGTVGIFAGGHAHTSMGPLYVAGTAPLTSALVEEMSLGRLASLEPEDVSPFIKRTMKYAIMHNNGSIIESDAVDGLRINIVSSSVRVPPSNLELVNWGDVDTLIEFF